MRPKNKCPSCDGLKDYRSLQCRPCRDAPTTTKRCTQCRKVKLVSEFRIRTRKIPRPRPQCKTCEAAYTSTRWAALSSEEKRARKAISRAKEKANEPVYRLQLIRKSIKLLGLDSEQDLIIAALEKQKVCAICRGAPRARLHIDHNHGTGKYRGLLCDNCNIGLGHFKDSPALLAKAIEYLKRADKPKRKP